MEMKLVESVNAENPVQGDLELFHGDFVWTTDLATEVVQRLRARFEFFMGEWYLNKNEGTPWFQTLLANKRLTDAAARAIFGSIIRGTPGVATLDYIGVTRDKTRRLVVTFIARLEDGYVLDSRKLPPFIVRF